MKGNNSKVINENGFKISGTGTARYRIATRGNDVYLIDFDSSPLSWLLGSFIWMFPFKAYQLENEPQVITSLIKRSKKSFISVPLAMGLTVMFSVVTRNWFQEQYFNNEGTKYLLIILVAVVAILFRMYLRGREEKKVMSTTGLKIVAEASFKIDVRSAKDIARFGLITISIIFLVLFPLIMSLGFLIFRNDLALFCIYLISVCVNLVISLLFASQDKCELKLK